MTELLPCPFCGVTGVILSDDRHEWALFEHKDSCLFPNVHKHEIPASDFAAWNTRANDTLALEKVITQDNEIVTTRTCRNEESHSGRLNDFNCSACGYFNDHREPDEVFNYCPNCGSKVVE